MENLKEYLRKNSNGTYSYIGTVRPENISPNVIEIPEGADIYAISKNWEDNIFFARPGGDTLETFNTINKNDWHRESTLKLENLENSYSILWLRHTPPEELPFIDDEPLQYAEIEKVRQSAWQKQEGGSHYKNLKIQPMQYALENKLDYAQANVVKYVTRHKEKNGKEDLLKAIHNIELMIEFYYGGGE